MKLVIDLLGGDLGLKETLEGVKLFIDKHKDVELILVGNKELIDIKNVKIIDANKAIRMDAHVMDILHDKDSSMSLAFKTAIEENADGIISCGSTGALLTLSTLRVKRLEGISRPALVSLIPNIKKDHKTLMLDLGASNDNSVDELVDFVKMGKVYYKVLTNLDANFALLSNGKEEEKGSPLICETRKKIKELNISNFLGYIEGDDILKGDVDLIVTDGYSGNIALKSIEGTGKIAKILLKKAFKHSLKNMIGYLLVKKQLNKEMSNLSSRPLGGAIFLGVNKVVIKAHGNSDRVAFKNAIELAYTSIKNDLINKIKGELDGK